MGMQTFHRGILDAKIASWTAENSYGTAYDVYGIRNATLTWTLESDQAEGDDAVLDRYSKIISVQLEFEQAAVDLEVVEMITGGTLVSNASYEDVIVGKEDDGIPYVAFAGRIASSDGGKDLQFFVPKAKISGNLAMRAQYGQYLFPGAQFQGVKEGEINGMLRLRKFTATTALEIPLRTTTGTT